MIGKLFAGILGAAVLLTPATVALAQTAQTPTGQTLRVAIANTGRIFREMQETRDLMQKMQTTRQDLQAQARRKQEDVRALQEARDQLRPDSPQYAEKNQELLKAAVELESWGKLNQADLQRQEKVQTKMLFEKVEAGAAEVARQRGIDLVLADTRGDIPNLEQLTPEQLGALLNQRAVLYSTPTVDISNDIIAHLDAQYKSGAAPRP